MRSRIQYFSHHGRRKYPSSVLGRFSSHIVVPVALIVIAMFILTGAVFLPSLSLGTTILAVLASLARLWIAYILCLVVGVALALIVEHTRRAESILLPFYDVLQSIPVLAFFPVIILFFVRSNFLEGAAIFMLFFSMIWSIVFNAIGGLKVIPADVQAVGQVFGLTKWQQFTRITLPALFPPLLTGSILALASGWNIVIVAEALHAYAPQSAHAHDLFGIGSILVNSSAAGDSGMFISAMSILVLVIVAVDLFVWQPLLSLSQRYKFE